MRNRDKFRVWMYFDGKVDDGFYLTEEENVFLLDSGALWRQDDCCDFSNSAIVEHCVGKHDVNGNLIFESDTVKFKIAPEEDAVVFGSVVWHDSWCQYVVKVVDENVSRFYPIHTLKAVEVIGNIHF